MPEQRGKNHIGKMGESKNYFKIKCHKCGKERVVFSRISTKVVCECKEVLAIPTGGKTFVKAEITQLI